MWKTKVNKLSEVGKNHGNKRERKNQRKKEDEKKGKQKLGVRVDG